MKRVVLLGGAGFLGLVAAERMSARGWRPIIVDTPRRLQRNADDLVGVETLALTDDGGYEAALDGADAAVLLAWASTPARSMVDIAEDLREAVLPALQMAMAATAARVPRLVFISSGGAIYGRTAGEPVDESHPTDPISAYGIGKLAVEKYVSVCTERSGTTPVILRVSNPVGPYQLRGTPVGVVGSIVGALRAGRAIPVFGDGSTVRDYIDVQDAGEAIALACDPERTPAGLFNVGAGEGRSINALIEIAAQVSGVTPQIQALPARPFDVPAIVLSNKRIAAACGWRPKITLTESIGSMWAITGAGAHAQRMEGVAP